MSYARRFGDPQIPGYPDHAAKENPMFKRLNYREPAVLRGIITALFTLAASLGFVATDEIKGFAEGLIPVVAFVLPLLQSLWTRQAVVSPQTHAETLGRHAAGLTSGPKD